MLILAKAVGVLLTLPGILILLAVTGLLLQKHRRVAGTVLIWVSLGALLVFSLPVTGYALLGLLERAAVPLPKTDSISANGIDAIVVLGGGRDADQPQYGGDTVNRFTLERLRYAARLKRATGLPLLVSGGSVFGAGLPEAEIMKQVAVRDFQIAVDWVEDRSRNTMENAIYSRVILAAAGKKRVWLVTNAWHMPRASWSFRHVGIDAVMAPTGFVRSSVESWLDFLPSTRGLNYTNLALHECLGLLWYRLRYGDDRVAETNAAGKIR